MIAQLMHYWILALCAVISLGSAIWLTSLAMVATQNAFMGLKQNPRTLVNLNGNYIAMTIAWMIFATLKFILNLAIN